MPIRQLVIILLVLFLVLFFALLFLLCLNRINLRWQGFQYCHWIPLFTSNDTTWFNFMTYFLNNNIKCQYWKSILCLLCFFPSFFLGSKKRVINTFSPTFWGGRYSERSKTRSGPKIPAAGYLEGEGFLGFKDIDWYFGCYEKFWNFVRTLQF